MPDTLNDSILDVLTRAELFRDVARRELFPEHVSLERFPAGAVVVQQGSEGRDIFVLVRGVARVEVEREGFTDVVATFENDGVFGEVSFLSGETERTASVVAETECEMLRMTRAQFERAAAGSPEAAADFYEALALRLARKLAETTSMLVVLAQRIEMVAKADTGGMLGEVRDRIGEALQELIGGEGGGEWERFLSLPPEVREQALLYGERFLKNPPQTG
ncbi:MAG: cyclic nucleotide-binding domain-containing protein [bacterium]|jgi:CRP-like cAMP-binding protein